MDQTEETQCQVITFDNTNCTLKTFLCHASACLNIFSAPEKNLTLVLKHTVLAMGFCRYNCKYKVSLNDSKLSMKIIA